MSISKNGSSDAAETNVCQKNLNTDIRKFDFHMLNQSVYLVQPFWDGNLCVFYTQVLTRAQYVSGGSPQVMFGGSRVTFRYWVMSAASG